MQQRPRRLVNNPANLNLGVPEDEDEQNLNSLILSPFEEKKGERKFAPNPWLSLVGGTKAIEHNSKTLFLPCFGFFMAMGVRWSRDEFTVKGGDLSDKTRARGLRKFVPLIIYGMEESEDRCDVLDPSSRKKKCKMFIQTFKDFHSEINDPARNNPLTWFVQQDAAGDRNYRLSNVLFPTLKNAVVNAIEMYEWEMMAPPGTSSYVAQLAPPLPNDIPRYKIRDKKTNQITNASMNQLFIYGSGKPITDYYRVSNHAMFSMAQHKEWLRYLFELSSTTSARERQQREALRATRLVGGQPDPNVPQVPQTRIAAQAQPPLIAATFNQLWEPLPDGSPNITRPRDDLLRVLLNQSINNYLYSQVTDNHFDPRTAIGRDAFVKQMLGSIKQRLKSQKHYQELERQVRQTMQVLFPHNLRDNQIDIRSQQVMAALPSVQNFVAPLQGVPL